MLLKGKMLWRCETSLRNAREIGVGGLCPPLSDNLKAKRLQGVCLVFNGTQILAKKRGGTQPKAFLHISR